MKAVISLVLFGLVFLGANPGSAQTGRSLEYSWLTDGRITGQQVVSYAPDGKQLHIRFKYADRGRGPDFESHITLDDCGLPLSFRASGLNNTRATIAEAFSLADDIATWRSSAEQGERMAAGDAFYLPYNISPEVIAVLARRLLAARDGRQALLPDGEASIEYVDKATVTSGDRTRLLKLYRISGVDVDPVYLWLESSGELFAYTQNMFAMIRKGWEPSMPSLKALEGTARTGYYGQLAARLAEPLAPLTAITGARIFDSMSGDLTGPATVFVWKGKIRAIDFDDTHIPGDAQRIDAAGQVLIPGLWDMHNHLKAGYLLNYLAFGVTNVRDMGNQTQQLQELMQGIRSETMAGPDIHAMGFIDRQGAFAAPVGRLAQTLDEALSHIDFYAKRGYCGIKIYSAIEPAWIAPMAAAARARGLPVVGHIPAFYSARNAILAGFSEITHINQLLLAFLGGDELDTRGPQRFLIPGIQTAGLDLESDEVNDFIALMRERDVAHDTTLAVILELFRNRPGEISPVFREVADHLPAAVRRKLVMTAGYNQGQEVAFDRSANVVLDLVRKLHQAGVPLLPGTDNLLPGLTLVRELIDYTEAGIPAAEVLQLATIIPARRMGLEHRIGSIEVGKDAQLVILDGNPLQDIRALYRVSRIIKGEHLFDARELLHAQGIRPFGGADSTGPREMER